jgi:selenocysteine lyase/cysteine desulfurase
VSSGTGLVANALEPGDEVVVPADEHVSDLFPLLVAGKKGVKIRQVPFDGLADAICPGTTLAAFSLVQMQTGRVADLTRICARAKEAGARVFVDATHGVPFVPVASHLDQIDYLVCAGYKHLLGLRGSSFLYVRKERLEDITPVFANWRSAADPFATFFGGPLSLAPDAARFNVSLAVLPWAGTTQSLRLIAGWHQDGTLAMAPALAAEMARQLELPAMGSFHVYNTEADIRRAVAAIQPYCA